MKRNEPQQVSIPDSITDTSFCALLCLGAPGSLGFLCCSGHLNKATMFSQGILRKNISKWKNRHRAPQYTNGSARFPGWGQKEIEGDRGLQLVLFESLLPQHPQTLPGSEAILRGGAPCSARRPGGGAIVTRQRAAAAGGRRGLPRCTGGQRHRTHPRDFFGREAPHVLALFGARTLRVRQHTNPTPTGCDGLI
ncbi:uncharacterized protein LOC128078703 isoform X2 [Tympanuchus pallidicinctus]|uniref:uncharacterized protein LOC128078703 isoform X2 n=1 Tax=Tympanuchus pallidicinctus TaxID=109042 RepID=UPI002286CF20|nr:uncharacterized protein LOC128078703 isoform X2 [Tympanuchus pallidicinctus]